jgi:hypothetical protein
VVGIFAVSGKCRTQDGRGQNTAHVSELISGTWKSRNLSRGSESLVCQPGVYDRVAAGTLNLEDIPDESRRVDFHSFFTRANPVESDEESEENRLSQ